MNQTIAPFLVNTVQPRAADIKSQADDLSLVLKLCIEKHTGILNAKKRSGGATLDAVRPDARAFVA
jgi:hypothetical protein